MSMASGVAARGASNLVGGAWRALSRGAGAIISRGPHEPERILWEGVCPLEHVDDAVAAARGACTSWSVWSFERRAAVLRTFAALAKRSQDGLAGLLADEVGKVLWDANAEATLLAAKVDATLDESESGGLRRVRTQEFALGPSRTARCWFRPHGVMAVVGPFNFPMHLPNGHIVPALLMGNTIVFKPSDKAPACGQALIALFDEALREHGAPPGVVNLVQGGSDIARTLINHDGIDGVLFTGSWPVGRAIMQANLDRPGRILALEMGGNNAAIVLDDADPNLAGIECVRSAFVGTGQRCTCTRRLIVQREIARTLLPAIVRAASSLVIGLPRASSPTFMGPIISEQARRDVLLAQERMLASGGHCLLRAAALERAGDTPACCIAPGIIGVERFHASEGEPFAGADVEVFGPLLRVCVVDALDEAIEHANATHFGLAASIFTRDQGAIDTFLARARAGCVNVNTGTAGASGRLPFGGLGLSGNHRPAGAFSLDYCAYPIGSMIDPFNTRPALPTGMPWDEQWLAS